MFSGHGSQWHGMGRELIHTEPVFSQRIEKIDSLIFKPLFSLILFKDFYFLDEFGLLLKDKNDYCIS